MIKPVKTRHRHAHTHKLYLIRLSVVSHGSRHDDSGVQTVLDAFNKCVLLVLRCFSEAFTDVLQSSDRLVAQLHPRLSGNDLNLGCNQEAQSSTGPRDGVEQVRVLLLRDGKNNTLYPNRNKQHIDVGPSYSDDVVSASWFSCCCYNNNISRSHCINHLIFSSRFTHDDYTSITDTEHTKSLGPVSGVLSICSRKLALF